MSGEDLIDDTQSQDVSDDVDTGDTDTSDVNEPDATDSEQN